MLASAYGIFLKNCGDSWGKALGKNCRKRMGRGLQTEGGAKGDSLWIRPFPPFCWPIPSRAAVAVAGVQGAWLPCAGVVWRWQRPTHYRATLQLAVQPAFRMIRGHDQHGPNVVVAIESPRRCHRGVPIVLVSLYVVLSRAIRCMVGDWMRSTNRSRLRLAPPSPIDVSDRARRSVDLAPADST